VTRDGGRVEQLNHLAEMVSGVCALMWEESGLKEESLELTPLYSWQVSEFHALGAAQHRCIAERALTQ
jgi:hypothetical protein